MASQKGQSVVEFALIIPLFLSLILGMIYGGFAYADYLQYSTAVREAARDISLQKADKRAASVERLNGSNGNEYADPLTKLYHAEFSAAIESGADGDFVKVTVNFIRNDDVLGTIIPLPETLETLQCTMPLEKEIPGESSSGSS
ncbi:TadE-like protein [Selenomonas ruminantium]|uniref:TadE-like protein n=1 Tax=Selenomonas ruminantium TaxID=971 RepID=A0A1M6S3F8_SELRU|nr:TadE family protein [Selenomonas ruminantium]SHK39384.1 TadE-like protein [Selenomonas ruminantium]